MRLDEIAELLDLPENGAGAPSLDTIESTLTDGYAAKLALEAERWRIERRLPGGGGRCRRGSSGFNGPTPSGGAVFPFAGGAPAVALPAPAHARGPLAAARGPLLEPSRAARPGSQPGSSASVANASSHPSPRERTNRCRILLVTSRPPSPRW